MEILRNLVSGEATASENAEESSGETDIPVGADMMAAAERSASHRTRQTRLAQSSQSRGHDPQAEDTLRTLDGPRSWTIRNSGVSVPHVGADVCRVGHTEHLTYLRPLTHRSRLSAILATLCWTTTIAGSVGLLVSSNG